MHVAACPDLDLDKALRKLASGPPVLSLANARELLGYRSTDEAEDVLAELEAEGWLESWDRPDGLSLVFTPMAAERLDIELATDGTEGSVFWTIRGKGSDGGPKHKPREVSESVLIGCKLSGDFDRPARGLDGFADPNADEPLDVMVREEHAQRTYDRYQATKYKTSSFQINPPLPRIILTGARPWPPLPDPEHPDVCPICKGNRIPMMTACGWCLRSSIDAKLPRVTRIHDPKSGPKSDGKKGGLGARRKAGKSKGKRR